MAWDKKYLDFGRVDFTNNSVSVYCSLWDRVNLPNIPSGIKNAYWQGSNVIVEMQDGWVYVFADGPYKNYTTRYKR